MSKPRHRNICFTLNAREGVELRLLDFSHPTWNRVTYCIYQREMGSHEHFQGYMEFDYAITFDAIKELDGFDFDSGVHLEPRRGPQKNAIHYCRKPVAGCDCNQCVAELANPTYLEGPWTFGEPKSQGQRTEMLAIQADIHKGISLKRLARDNFNEFARYGKFFREYKGLIAEPRDFKTICICIVGPSGLGKSRFATNLCKYLSTNGVYKLPTKSTGLWCDKYDYQDVFFIDEMGGHKMNPEMWNELCDRYECELMCHHGPGHQMRSKYLVVCSNYLPKFWWRKRSVDQIKQTMRRIEVIIPFWKRTGDMEHVAFGQTINPNTIPPKDKGELDEPEPMDLEDPIYEDDCRGD